MTKRLVVSLLVVVLLAGAVGGSTTATFIDTETAEVEFETDAGSERSVAVMGEDDWEDDIRAETNGSDVIVVTVAQKDPALELVFSRVIDEPATIYLDTSRLDSFDSNNFTVTIDRTTVDHEVVGGKIVFRLQSFSSKTVTIKPDRPPESADGGENTPDSDADQKGTGPQNTEETADSDSGEDTNTESDGSGDSTETDSATNGNVTKTDQ